MIKNKIKILSILSLILIELIIFRLPVLSVEKNTSKNQKLRDLEFSLQFLEKSEKMQGLFNIYKYKDKYYLEIPYSKLKKEYFFSLQVSKGTSVYPFLGGLTLPVFEPTEYTNVVYFDSESTNYKKHLKDGDSVDILFYAKNVKYRSSFDTASSNLLNKSFSDNLILKVKSIYYKENYYIDLLEFSSSLPLFFNVPPYNKTINARFNDLNNVKNFPNNFILYLSYLVSYKPSFGYYNTLNLVNNNEVILALNIFDYENDNYKPRIYDPRVGYFSTTYADVSSTEAKDGYRTIKRFINTWDLDNKKLTIWIENTFPQEYREVVKEGILEWNKAFNKIGYDDPIEVKIQPDDADWEPEDIRYTTVRYQDSNLTTFAIGPSIALPTTGEIVDADIVFYAPMLRIMKSRFDYYYDVILPTSIKYQLNPLYRISYELIYKNLNNQKNYNLIKETISLISQFKDYYSKNYHLGDLDSVDLHEDCQCCYDHNVINVCDYALQKTENALLAITSIIIDNPNYYELNKEKFVKDYVKDIIIHEVGHILGLRHNFKASSFVSISQLQDENYTSKNGITYSCMDYNPVNITYKNGKPYFTKDIFMTQLGYYDYLAIEYGYTKNENELKNIAAKSSLYYGPDEDLFILDPNIAKFDLSSTPYKWYEDMANLYVFIMQNAPYKLNKYGNDPKFLYWTTRSSLNSYINVKLENLFYYLVGKNFSRFFLGENKKNIEMIDSKLRDFVSSSVIKDLSSNKVIIPIDSLYNSVIFGDYEWGTISTRTTSYIDLAYYFERIYRLTAMIALILPLSSQYEYYFNEEIVSKNIRKLYFTLFEDIKFNQDISQIRQQTIEDYVFLLLFIQGYTKINSSEDPLILNFMYLPKSRNESLGIIHKIQNKLESIKNNPLSTSQNKLFATRLINLINYSLDR